MKTNHSLWLMPGMMTLLLFPVLAFLFFGCTSRDLERQDPDGAHTLMVSEDGRRIVRSDGAPFFWLGDTAWELFHRLNREEADEYLSDRASKGFNVIQAVVLAELDGLTVPNPYGEIPLIDNDPAKPNEAYFQHVDYVVDKAESLGMFIGMLPTWGDKFNKAWGGGPEIFTVENARIYGRFLGERYRDDPIIWILGGDRNPADDEDLAIIRAMAEGIQEGNGGTQLMTYHPQGESASYDWFHDDDWLDVNLFQSGHTAFDYPDYLFTEKGYALQPVKPVIDGEPRYEDHPVNWNPENGWFEAFDVRQAAYWSVLSGAAGHTYGDHNIWQMWREGLKPVSTARTPWETAIHHVGSTQMGLMKNLFESRPFLTLIPDQAVLVSDPGSGGEHVRAARDSQGRYLLVYTPYGKDVEVNLSLLTGERAVAWWFDPRTGEASEIGTLSTSETGSFDPPGEPERGNDWILVVDAEAAGFGNPGTPSSN